MTSSSTRLDAQPHGSARTAWPGLLVIAAAFAIFHFLTNGQYGFHRDELQFLSDARHLDWGFVAYPPFTAFIENISLHLFGLSLTGLRLASVLAQTVVVIVSGLMARDLGGNRIAQTFTALAVALSPLVTFEATEFQYTTFGILWWVLVSWFTIRLLKSENPRWWLAIGAAIGFGFLTKYSVTFFVAGLLVGMVLTRARRYLASPWFWSGVGLALLLFSPNIAWLVRHDFISYRFLQHIHARDVGQGRAHGFWKGQFIGNANLFAAPVWILGLIAFFADRRYRMLAWMYVVPVAFFWLNKGRFYYVAEAYPPLVAMGSVAAERWLAKRRTWQRVTIEAVFVTGVLAIGAISRRSSCRSHRVGRCALLRSRTAAICARRSGGTNWSAQLRAFAIHSPPTNRPISASRTATTASMVRLKFSGLRTTCRPRSARTIQRGCTGIPLLNRRRSSCSAWIRTRQTHSSPTAGSRDTMAMRKG